MMYDNQFEFEPVGEVEAFGLCPCQNNGCTNACSAQGVGCFRTCEGGCAAHCNLILVFTHV